jgi:hypothetical protein
LFASVLLSSCWAASGSLSQIAGLHRLQMNFDPGVSDFVRKSQESLISLHRWQILRDLPAMQADGFSSG